MWEPMPGINKMQFSTAKLRWHPALSAKISGWEIISWSHAQTWNTPVKVRGHPPSSPCLARLVASRNISLCKTVQSNELEEVVCWYYEKKYPSNTKIVQTASVYGSEETNSSANLTPDKPKRPVYLGHSYTHMQETETQQLSSDFILYQRG